MRILMRDSDRSGGSWLAAAGLRLSDWFEHWFPDAFALALVAVVIVFTASVAAGNSPVQSAAWFGAGFWDLVNFTMQMTLIIITGYSVATAPPDLPHRLPAERGAENRTQRRRVRRALLDALVADFVEFQPDHQRAAGSRGDPSRSGRRLSRGRRRRIPRHRQRVGARTLFVSRAHHGRARIAAPVDSCDQRRDPAPADAAASGKACSRPASSS